MNSSAPAQSSCFPPFIKRIKLLLARLNLCSCVLLLATLLSGETTFAAEAAMDDSIAPCASETPAQHDARMAWWRDARFGLFIHWGVYSVPAGTYEGKPVAGIGEWIMNNGRIPVAKYQAFAKQFDPTNFHAGQWVKLAKAAGIKYIVITAKHHDGFAMFDSKVSHWNIVTATPYAHDPLKDLAAACQKEGIRLGFYYSQAQDWNNGGAVARGKWDPAQNHDMDDYIQNIAVPQIREILSNYGKISVLWFDTPVDMNPARAEKILPLLKLQPGIIYNDRLGGGFKGDTETPEQYIPATGFTNRDWETCMTINDTWGYKSYDHDFKSTGTLLRNLIDIASKGGNYLLNVGPDSTGVIPPPEAERLLQIGQWMKVNGEAIYGTTASPFGEELGPAAAQKDGYGQEQLMSSAWVWRCTKRATPAGVTLYLHIFQWPKDGRFLVPGLKQAVAEAYLLKPNIFGGYKHLKTSVGDDGLTILLPAVAPDKIASVVVLKINGPLELQPNTAAPDAVPTPPPAALGASYTKLTFDDEFDSIGTIDVNNTHAPGYNWYVQLPFRWGASRPDDYEVTNGVLKINTGESAGWVISTWSGPSGNGHAFRYGFFEARVHFDPAQGLNSKSWPAFWSFPVEHAWGPAQQHWNELDFFEAYTGGYRRYGGGFFGTVHDWIKDAGGKPINHQNSNNYTPLKVDWNQWHNLGCLWMPGRITWYLDDVPLKTVHYSSGQDGSSTVGSASPNARFSIMDAQSNLLVLGASKGWPMYVDYVRVWQK